jgi:adenylate cyclase
MSTTDQMRLAELEDENEQLRNSLTSMRSFMQEGMAPYVTPEVLEEILKQEAGTGIRGERRIVTMMFADLRKSTELSELMDPVNYIRLLNHYFEDMIMIIDSWQGNITSFVGDCLVTVFGAPRVNESAASQAVCSAVSMQRRMVAINKWNNEQGYPSIQMGIGIHTGEAILGCVGSSTRMKYDMIGRNVNLASRIEGFTQGGQILISSETLEAAGEKVIVRPDSAMWVSPRGIHEKVLVHDVIGYGSLRLPDA